MSISEAAAGPEVQRRGLLRLVLAAAGTVLGGCGGGAGADERPAADAAGVAADDTVSPVATPPVSAPAAAPVPAPAPPDLAPAPAPAPQAQWPDDYASGTGGRTWHVAPTGSDAATGSALAPFATLSHVMHLVQPGDTVVVEDGTYHEAVVLARSGGAGRYITVRAARAGRAHIRGPAGSYSALRLQGAGWIRIEGLDLQADLGHGIDAEACHHVQLVGNSCHDCGGSGISLQAGDYYLVEANAVFRNASTNRYQTSGISIYQPRAWDAAPGFHIVVRRNVSHSNIESVTGLAQTTEGNGIILDDFHNSQPTPGSAAAGSYAPATLVENNVVYNNGGNGIVAYESDHVTVRHNTVAFNNTDPLNTGTWRAELLNSQGRDNRWVNNIAVCSTAANPYRQAMVEGVTAGFANTGSVWSGNLLFDTAAPARDAWLVDGAGNRYAAADARAGNLLRADPRFAGGGAAAGAAAYRTLAGSAARGAALPAYAAAADIDGRARDATPDIGAYES